MESLSGYRLSMESHSFFNVLTFPHRVKVQEISIFPHLLPSCFSNGGGTAVLACVVRICKLDIFNSHKAILQFKPWFLCDEIKLKLFAFCQSQQREGGRRKKPMAAVTGGTFPGKQVCCASAFSPPHQRHPHAIPCPSPSTCTLATVKPISELTFRQLLFRVFSL